MRQAQIIAHGIDGPLADKLRELAQARRFRLRETSQLSACANLLQTETPSALILALGRDVEKELGLLEAAHASWPATALIVIGETNNPVLAALAWDLGATFVLFPPTPMEWLADLLARTLPGEAP